MTTDIESNSICGFTDTLKGLFSVSNVQQSKISTQINDIRKTCSQTSSRSFTDVLRRDSSNHYRDENEPILERFKRETSNSKPEAHGSSFFNGVGPSTDENAHLQVQESIRAPDYETLDVHETYQLGYCMFEEELENNSKLYIFDFVDSLEVSYPINVPRLSEPPLDIPLIFLEPDYIDQLVSLASSVFSWLTNLLNEWLSACQHADEQLFIWQHMAAHEEAFQLRKQILELLNILVPQSVPSSTLDFHSPRVDQFINLLISAITAPSSFPNECPSAEGRSDQLYPVVSLCPDPHHCLSALRAQIVLLLKTVLPQLVLPQSFDPCRDLSILLSTICQLNRQA